MTDSLHHRPISSPSMNASSANSQYESTSEIKVGARCQVQGKSGIVRFVGSTSFQTGKWVGIELDGPQGKNSGVVQGKRYFDCKVNHGVFVRPSQVKLLVGDQKDEHQSSSAILTKSESSSSGSSNSSPFAPAQDPHLQAARSIQQHAPASSSSTLLPSRIASPSKISRLPNIASVRNKAGNSGRASKIAGLAAIGARKSTSMNSYTEAQNRYTPTKEIQNNDEVSISYSKDSTTDPSIIHEEPQQYQKTMRKRNDLVITPSSEDSNLTTSNGEAIASPVPAGSGSARVHTTSSTASSTIYSQPRLQQHQEPPNYGSLAEELPVSKSDQMVSLKEYEELRFKLKILESKRQEDRERYREHEKIKEEAEQFLTLRNKLQDRITELQKDVRDTRRELKDSEMERESFESKYNDILESLEIMTVDKEVAEERAEALQQEVNILKDKIEEISVDLDIMKKEASSMDHFNGGGGENGERTQFEIVQLERHNERLKEALLRLRDATTARENELCDKVKELEKENIKLEETKLLYGKNKEKLEIAELTIEDLKQRLDDALGAEDLVEQLTEKNLALTETNEELRMVIDDLEALKELADELEENHVETEKQLQAEIDHRDILLRDQLERLRTSAETIADYETTIQQFRELVTTLQGDLEHLRNQQANQQSEQQNLNSQSQAMMSLNLQLQSTVVKAQAKSIDLELRKLDAAQANDRLAYIQPYLPDSFFKSENDSVSCILLFKRLVFKADLIVKHLDQIHPISENLANSTVPQSLIVVCEIRQRAGYISALSKRFVTFIANCEPLIFIKMGHVYHNLIGTERRLNGIIDLLRNNDINNEECITELQRMISQLEHLTDLHLSDNEVNNVDQFYGLVRSLDLNADSLAVELSHIKQTVSHAVKEEDTTLADGSECLVYDFLEPIGRLVVQAKSNKILARKLLRQLDDLSEQALTLKPDYLHQFKTLNALALKLGKFCYIICKQISAYVESKVDSKEEISLKAIQQMILVATDEVLEIVESSMWEGCLRILNSLTSELNNTLERVLNETKTDKISTVIAPWIQRASDLKAEIVMSQDMERKLQQHSDEIVKLMKDIKLKEQTLQESNIKVEILEKRIEVVKKQALQITALEESLDKSQAQAQMYAEAMENLQMEYEALERENLQLKKDIANKTEEKRANPMQNNEIDSIDTASIIGPTDMDIVSSTGFHQLRTHVDKLQAAIRYLRAENAYLKTIDIARTLQLDNDKTLSSNLIRLGSATANRNPSQSVLESYSNEARTLTKDIRAAGATPRVVRLSTVTRGGKWQSEKQLPHFSHHTQQAVLYTIKKRCDLLNNKVRIIGCLQPSTARLVKKCIGKEDLQLSLAKIQLPKMDQLSNNRCIKLSSLHEFKKIHSIFTV